MKKSRFKTSIPYTTGRDGWKHILIVNVYTLPDNFCSPILFTHKNGGFDAIPVTQESYSLPIS